MWARYSGMSTRRPGERLMLSREVAMIECVADAETRGLIMDGRGPLRAAVRMAA